MQEETKIITGKVLKKFRKMNGLTLKDVSEKIGKSKSWLGDIESGRNRIYFDDLKELCDLYNLDIKYLFDEINKSSIE